MKVVNIYKMHWFRREAIKQMLWLDENGQKELSSAYKEMIVDYDWNINDIERILNASD